LLFEWLVHIFEGQKFIIEGTEVVHYPLLSLIKHLSYQVMPLHNKMARKYFVNISFNPDLVSSGFLSFGWPKEWVED